MNNKTFSQLRVRLGEIYDVRAAIALLEWDQEVNMPAKAGPDRGQQLATMNTLAHRLFTSPETGDLIAACQGANLVPDQNAAAFVAEAAYDYERATKLPAAFVQRFTEEQNKAYHAWLRAREQSDFGQFRPHLETVVDLLREKADRLGYAGSPYNALLEDHERGMTADRLDTLFSVLAKRQSELVRAAVERQSSQDHGWLEQTWDEQIQWDVSLRVLADMGYDFEAGRQDRSVHPFTANFGMHDVRVTTRVSPDEPFSGLTASMHEGGHALYEQGFREEDARGPLSEAPSLGIHESQSRMWENMVGRSLPFWEHYTPLLKDCFGSQLEGVGPEMLYRAINRVRPSFIRVDADECTYNLHVIVRFEIERGLVEGTLSVEDVPAAWNAKMKEYLGVDVPDDAHGCLQDIHWAWGAVGYFPTYTLGNLYSAELFEAVLEAIPDLWEHVRQGDFEPLLAWLRENVHRVGRRMTAEEIVRAATGKEPGPEAYLRYLEQRYVEGNSGPNPSSASFGRRIPGESPGGRL